MHTLASSPRRSVVWCTGGDLRAAGIARDEVRSEVRGGRWTVLGRHTIGIDAPLLTGEQWVDLAAGSPNAGSPQPAGRLATAAWAVWETGSGAVLDGVSGLLAAGLENYTEDRIFVTVPRGTCPVRLPGVRVHSRRVITAAPSSRLPRAATEAAVVNAATWADSERQAALLVILAVQQRLTTAARLTDEVGGRGRVRRRDFLRRLLLEVGGGVQHQQGLAPVQDALRDNEVRLRGGPVLRIPSLGLLTDPAAFMGQVKVLLARAGERSGATRSRGSGHP